MLRAVWRWLVTRPKSEMRPLEIIWWWELRRIPYNAIVGMVGAVSLALFLMFIWNSGVLKPGEDAVEPMALFAAPFVVNLCYTAGWVVELLLVAIRRHEVGCGITMFVVGTAFSLIVVMVPSVTWGVVWLVKLLAGAV